MVHPRKTIATNLTTHKLRIQHYGDSALISNCQRSSRPARGTVSGCRGLRTPGGVRQEGAVARYQHDRCVQWNIRGSRQLMFSWHILKLKYLPPWPSSDAPNPKALMAPRNCGADTATRSYKPCQRAIIRHPGHLTSDCPAHGCGPRKHLHTLRSMGFSHAVSVPWERVFQPFAVLKPIS